MEGTKVAQSVAEADIKKWLDHKMVREKKRETNKDSIETLVEAVMEGDLTYDEKSHKLIQKIRVQGEGDNPIKELKFKPRLKVGEAEKQLKGIEATNINGMIIAYIAALTENNLQVIRNLDTEDISIARAVAVFFL